MNPTDINSLIGKVLLIGVTLLDKNENVLEQIQVFGPIKRIDGNGVVIKRNVSGADLVIPPDFENIHKAKTGEYKLRSTGEVVIDPDFVSSWTVHCANSEMVNSYHQNGFLGYIK